MLRFYVAFAATGTAVTTPIADYQYALSVKQRFERSNPGVAYVLQHRV